MQEAPAHVVEVLRSARLLHAFTQTGLQILATVALEKTLPAGTPLFVENMIGDSLYIIASGRIRVSMRGADGAEIPLSVLGPGDSLGEAALLRSGPRMCSATADDETVVLELSRRDIAALQKTKPQACLKLMMGVIDALGERMRAADPELRAFVSWRAGRAG